MAEKVFQFSQKEVDMMRQWFDAVQDVTPGYLNGPDYTLAAQVYALLGVRVPGSIVGRMSDGKKEAGTA